jgi:hypothetical protein
VAAITLAERFERKVDRSGEHHLWLGTRDAEGAGQIRVEGKPRTARSVAWELVNGSLPQGARVRGCPDESACVRTSHLSLLHSNGRPRRRGLRGSGSTTMVRPWVWKLAVTVGRFRGRLSASSTHDDSCPDEIVRDGGQQMLAAALQAEVAAYVEQFRDEVDEAGHRLVVRNGYHAPREVTTAAGAVPVKQPRVNDKRIDETAARRRRTPAACSPGSSSSRSVAGRSTRRTAIWGARPGWHGRYMAGEQQ